MEDIENIMTDKPWAIPLPVVDKDLEKGVTDVVQPTTAATGESNEILPPKKHYDGSLEQYKTSTPKSGNEGRSLEQCVWRDLDGDDEHFEQQLDLLEADSALSVPFDGSMRMHGDSVELRIPPTEALTGSLLLKNVIFTRSTVLKHRVIYRSGKTRGTLTEEYKPPTALQNYRYWIDSCMDPSIQQVTGFSGQGEDLAILESAELNNKWDEKVLLKIKHNVYQKYSGDMLAVKVGTRAHTEEIEDGFIRKKNRAEEEKKSLFISRLAMALFGGLALIAPMLIMTLHQTRLTTLLTTSLFVVAVAVALAWWMEDAQNKDIIAATAAYTAVLVVFVGSGTSNTT